MALKRYWKQNPPVHMLLALFMGYKPSADAKADGAPESTPPVNQEQDIGSFVALFQQMGGAVNL